MPTWNSRGLRGSTLEEFINRTNERYRENHLALIQKVPTPITPIKMDKESRHITLAYFCLLYTSFLKLRNILTVVNFSHCQIPKSL